MKKFAYIFALGHKVVWSGETEKTLLKRTLEDVDRTEIEHFVKIAEPGHHMSLSTGEMVLCTE